MLAYPYSYQSPEHNLAIDDYLLDCVNQGQYPQGILRTWESPSYFVVLGISKKIRDDVLLSNCETDGIPILKRSSGGGTVLQGPGCFNYGFILPTSLSTKLDAIPSTTAYVLSMVASVLSTHVNGVTQSGVSDLTVNQVKFSGNAQRRMKQAILFHGTILYDFNLPLVSKYLKHPPIQPDYRNNRPHHAFIQNIDLTQSVIQTELNTLTTGNIARIDSFTFESTKYKRID